MIYKEIGNNLISFNVSSGLPNFSQRNNEYLDEITNKKIAHSMCNVTSYCMAYSYTGAAFPKTSKKYTQEEDQFIEFLRNSKEVNDYYKNLQPSYYKAWKNNEKDNYPPEQIHDVLNYAFNLWVGWRAASLHLKAEVNSMIKFIMEDNRPMVLSGKFGRLNHIVCLVGLVADKEILEHLGEKNLIKYVKKFIIDDPYGDFRDGYKTTRGNDVEMTSEDFVHIFKPVDDINFKICHFFHAPVAAV